jgi:hypothetical protein
LSEDLDNGVQQRSSVSGGERVSYNDARENLLSPIESSYKDESEEEEVEETKTVNLCKYF